MMRYNVQNWYWIVDDDETRVWSSSSAAYVQASDNAYKTWVAQGGIPTRIDSEANLAQVFAQQFPEGWPDLAIKARLAALDILLPRSLENYWETTNFDSAGLHPKQRAILEEKQSLREDLS